MPYLKSDNSEATIIHEEYQASGDQKAFLKAARDFLSNEQQKSTATLAFDSAPGSAPVLGSLTSTPTAAAAAPMSSLPFQPSYSAPSNVLQPPMIERTQQDPSNIFGSYTQSAARLPGENLFTTQSSYNQEPLNNMRSIENGLDSLLRDDPIVPLPSPPPGSIWSGRNSTITPPRQISSQASSPWSLNGASPRPQISTPGPIASPGAAMASPSSIASPSLSAATSFKLAVLSDATPKSPVATSFVAPETPKGNGAAPPLAAAKKEAPPPKRLWTHFDEQPGRLAVDGVTGEDSSRVLPLAPRYELTAFWSVPLEYLNQKRRGATSLEQALAGLTVGLFRRGCTENGSQASIISKKVLGDDNRSYDYGLDPASGSVRGKVPFFSPRTPGHVLFRLYWEAEPLYTLAMGPTLLVRVLEDDFENSVRFILSNFKGKKSNPTSLSSLNSLAQVLETSLTRPNESAARAVFGCIQEARKVVEACALEYLKTSNKLSQLESTVEDLKKQVEEEDTKSQDITVTSDDDDDEIHGESEASTALKEKRKALMSGRASCERKWRDSQLAFASILRAVVTNPTLQILLRREMITRMRLEFELWCPLSEEFAMVNEKSKMWYDALRDVSQTISQDDFQQYSQARAKMQMRTLSFEPTSLALDDVLFPRNRGVPNQQRSMDPRAVTVFNNMSAAMGQYYQELFINEDAVVQQREIIRSRTEKCVEDSGAFPPGTKVVIFGSSANGFGSPKSDIDMCLQIPQGAKLDGEEGNGVEAMTKLPQEFESCGMKDVDTVRLTARIPIIKFFCPVPGSEGGEGEFVECDLSMHNPLAVLNTSLLRTYAEITPVTRVLAAIVKRWAKARDINNPAHHTLSSYGYIIMLLHFLTYHKRSGNGLMSPMAPAEGEPEYRREGAQQPTPLLPNLHWMDPLWPNFPRGTPYRELSSLPKTCIAHPFEEGKTVNAYFCQPQTPNDKAILQVLFPGQDLSLAILLASFFRYYAYEFDYKRFVVSLHSTAARGLVEREVKAELDGWRNYSAALTIEDPFETFYDVAHVLRGGYYHRIRREFAVAYTKIADAASGRGTSWSKGDLRALSGNELIDWICEAVEREP